LRTIAADLGFVQARTYIQSGNLLFHSALDAPTMEHMLAGAVEQQCGFRPAILLRTVEALSAALAANPHAARVTDGKQLHIFFCDGPITFADEAALRALLVDGEDFTVMQQGPDSLCYLFARDGIGRSRLAEKLPRQLPKRHTARNLNTIKAMIALAQHD
jgi:uncharacterized protein (DUF1697 family)